MGEREPIGGGSRRTGEMQPSRPPLASPHSSHDLLVLAAAVDRHAEPGQRTAAASQVAICADCAAIAAELRALATGLAALPPSRSAPRDMRLSVEQAARLRRGGLWRRLLRPFGEQGLPVLRPLAAALTTLGLAGILLTAVPLGLGSGGAALAPMDQNGSAVSGPGAPSSAGGENAYNASAAPVPAATTAGGQPPTDAKGSSAAPASSAELDLGTPQAGNGDRGATTPTGTGPRLPPMGWLSLGLVVAGLGLFGVLFVARRVA